MNHEQIKKVINLLSDKNDNKAQALSYLKKQLKKPDTNETSDLMYSVFRQLSLAHANIRTLHIACKNDDVPQWAILDALESIDDAIFGQLNTIFDLFKGDDDETI